MQKQLLIDCPKAMASKYRDDFCITYNANQSNKNRPAPKTFQNNYTEEQIKAIVEAERKRMADRK